jgi:hypoxanthine phosphoribosyltransferase
VSAARVLIPPPSLQAAVRRLGAEISAAHPEGVLLVAVLKGSVPFLADLARAVTVPVEVDFLAISSYAPDTGRVRLLKDLDADIAGRDVVLVEDIVDTGLTLTYLLGELALREPRSLEACALLDRAVRRIVPTPVRFVGFTVGDEYVVGYGMDFAERYRNLDLIAAADVRALRADRDAHVVDFYAR